MAISELTRRRWRTFRANRRAAWSLVIFSVLFLIALFAEFVRGYLLPLPARPAD